MTDYRFFLRTYQLVAGNPRLTNQISLNNLIQVSFTRLEADVGSIVIDIPISEKLEQYEAYSLIEVERNINDGPFALYRCYFLIDIGVLILADSCIYRLIGQDINIMLSWRVLASEQSVTYPNILAQREVATLMHRLTSFEYQTNNIPFVLGDGSRVNRVIPGRNLIATGAFEIDVPPLTANAPNAPFYVDVQFGTNDVLFDVLKDIMEYANSRVQPYYITFDMRCSRPGVFRFDTYIDQLGTDRRNTLPPLGAYAGTLANIEYIRRQEPTFNGGWGTVNSNGLTPATNFEVRGFSGITQSINKYYYTLRESVRAHQDGLPANTTLGLGITKARQTGGALLQENKGFETIIGQLVLGPLEYGSDIDFGDQVRVILERELTGGNAITLDGRIGAENVTISPDDGLTIEIAIDFQRPIDNQRIDLLFP